MVAQIDAKYIAKRPTRLWSRLVSYALFEGRPLTTKGRFINPAIKAHVSALQMLPALRSVHSPAFILGTGRSGTTILGIVLSMHKDVGFLNEPKILWSQLRDDEDLIGSYNRNSARYRLDAADATPSIVNAARKVFGGYLAISNSRQLVDKYPELIFRTHFVQGIFPDAKFLFLSRSGRATCASVDGWSKRLGVRADGETHDWWGANDRKWLLLIDQIVPEHADLAAHRDAMRDLDDIGRAAVEWVVTMREGMRLLANDPDHVLHVPYEQLCADPVTWAKRLESFLKLDRDATFCEYAADTLVDPAREISFNLPQWLDPIFERTEAELVNLTKRSSR